MPYEFGLRPRASQHACDSRVDAVGVQYVVRGLLACPVHRPVQLQQVPQATKRTAALNRRPRKPMALTTDLRQRSFERAVRRTRHRHRVRPPQMIHQQKKALLGAAYPTFDADEQNPCHASYPRRRVVSVPMPTRPPVERGSAYQRALRPGQDVLRLRLTSLYIASTSAAFTSTSKHLPIMDTASCSRCLWCFSTSVPRQPFRGPRRTSTSLPT